MKKEMKNSFYTTKDDGEFSFRLNYGELFISIHSDQNAIGKYFNKNELNEVCLKEFHEEVKKYFLNNKLNDLVIKFIGHTEAIKIGTKIFQASHFKQTKQIDRDRGCEIIFIPSQNRVRLNKENDNVTVLKKSIEKVKVLIVDDSKTIRTILNKMFSSDPQFEVIGMLERPTDVDQFISKNRPDVVTLDIHMPEMDGVTLLKKIYPKYKIPCVMISSISLAEGPMVFDALENGAVDYIQKPEAKDIAALTPVILEKVKMAANVKVKNQTREKANIVQVKESTSQDALVVIGSSTGGTEALREILTALPDQIPPILIVQHIPAVFSQAFAKRMNDLCSFEVVEACNGDEVKPNRVIIAPGGKQMKLVHKNGKTFVEINDDEPVNRFKPSVDYLFDSVEKDMYCHTVAVILTGMGKDGAKGILKLKNKGAVTIAQNEETCVVFGMPREAIAIGGATYIEPLNCIAERITQATKQKNILKKVGNL